MNRLARQHNYLRLNKLNYTTQITQLTHIPPIPPAKATPPVTYDHTYTPQPAHPASSPSYSDATVTPLSLSSHIAYLSKHAPTNLPMGAPKAEASKLMKVLGLASFIFSVVVIGIWGANAVIVYEKEQKILELIRRRNKLREIVRN